MFESLRRLALILIVMASLDTLFQQAMERRQYASNNGASTYTGYDQDQFIIDYWNKIQQYKGTPYYEQLLNNPYIGQQYSGSTIGNLLQSNWLYFLTMGLSSEIGENLNDTGRAQFEQQQNQAAMEEFDRIIGQKRQDEYNSPSQQVSREIAAGINPQLVGVSGTPAAGSPGPDETASPLSSAGIAESQDAAFQQLGGYMSSFITGCLNLYSFFQDAEGKSIANAAGDISLADSVYTYALKTAAGMSSLPASRAEYDALSEEEKLSADTMVYETLKEAVKTGDLGSMQLNRRARSMLKKMTGRVMFDKEGKPTLAFQQQRASMLKSFYGDTLEAGKSAGHPVMSTPDDFASVLEKSVDFFGKFEQKVRDTMFKLRDIELRTASASAQSAEAQALYDKGMYDTELGQKENDALKAEADARKVTAELDSYLDSELDSLLDELDGYGLGGKIGKIAIVGLRSALKSYIGNFSFKKK